MNSFKNMKTYTYTLRTLSPVILSPRSSQAFYSGIDYEKDAYSYNIIYPFYRYGEYNSFETEQAKYHIPGSSIKGSLTFGSNEEKTSLSLFVDDISDIKADSFEVIPLNKSQYFNLPKGKNAIPKIKEFFDKTVGFECLKAEVELTGKARFAGDFSDFVQKASERAKVRCQNDIAKMEGHIESIEKPNDYATNLNSKEAYDKVVEQICKIKCHVEDFCKRDSILLGGYKGLMRALNCPGEDTQGAIFATVKNIPLGFAEILSVMEVEKDEQKQ